MQYWEEMASKYGFGDGGQYPAGVEIFRDTYLKAINALAGRYGSECRYVPYNRPGVHNFCLVVAVDRKWFKETYLPAQKENEMWLDATEEAFNHEVSELDSAMNDAFLEIDEMNIDQYIDVTVRVSPDFSEFLSGVRDGSLSLSPDEEI